MRGKLWITIILCCVLVSAALVSGGAAAMQGLLDASNAGWYEVGAGSANGGGISNLSESSMEPSVATAPNNMVYVAWQDTNSGNWEIYVRRWNGSAWEALGGSASGSGISNSPNDSIQASVAVDSNGTPYVAWLDDSYIYLRYWDGDSWEQLGGSASGTGIGSGEAPSLKIGPSNQPYVAWAGYDTSSETYLRYWDGDSWEELGGSATGGGISDNTTHTWVTSLAFDPSGTPYVAWDDTDPGCYGDPGGDREIYVRYWDGDSWEETNAGSAQCGGVSDNTGISGEPSLAINPADGQPFLAWRDDSGGNEEIYVIYYIAAADSWAPVGSGSASGGGISNTEGHSREPSLAFAPGAATPTVAWEENGYSGNQGIYVRRWSGQGWANSWIELDAGSASGGGISGSAGESQYPSLAFAPSGTAYVAWNWRDNVSTEHEIFIRRHLGRVFLPLMVAP